MRAEALRYVVKNFSERQNLQEHKNPQRFFGKTLKDAEREREESLGVKLTEEISSYFKTLGNPPYLREILLETASQLIDESKTSGAVLALQKIIELDPNSENNPGIDSQIVEIFENANRPLEAREMGLKLLERYGKSSHWYQAQSGNERAQKIAREAVRDTMLFLAVQSHTAGKEKKKQNDIEGSNRDFAEAISLYRDYVMEFPERDDVYKAIFYYAESSYEMGHFHAALDAYTLLKIIPCPWPITFVTTPSLILSLPFVRCLRKRPKSICSRISISTI